MTKLRFEHWPIVWFWPISLILMQLTLGRIGDFQITWAVIALHLLQLYLITFYWLRRPPDRQILIGALVLLYVLVIGIGAAEPSEFWRSLAHVANLLATLLICMNARLEQSPAVGRSLAVFCALAAVTALLIAAQAIDLNLFRSARLARPLGDFAPIGPGFEVYEPSTEARLPRAHGLYSEPSVAGWFMIYAASLALAARRRLPRTGALAAALCLLAAMATLSLTGILGAVIVLAAHALFVRERWSFKLAWMLVFGAVALVALVLAHQHDILGRFRYFDQPGTSIYFRLNAPSRLVADSLAQHPFGHAVGQTGYIASRDYYINWEEGARTNIDNSLLLIVFYLGLLGIVLNLAYVWQLARFLVLKRHAVGLIMLSLLIALLTTGSGWAHHFALMIGYAVVVGRHLLAEGVVGRRAVGAARADLTRPPTAPRAAPPAPAGPHAARLRAAWRLAGGAA